MVRALLFYQTTAVAGRHLSKELESIVVLKRIAVCSEQILRYSADEGGPMRKVVAMELVSLDGVLEGHGGVPGL